MKSKFLLVICISLLASCYANATENPPTNGGEESLIKKVDIIGGVSNTDTKKPVANVVVTAYLANKKEKSVTTDASGNFSFDDLRPGTYKFVFEKSGYKRVTREKTIARVDEAFDLSVQMEEHSAFNFAPGPSSFFDFE